MRRKFKPILLVSLALQFIISCGPQSDSDLKIVNGLEVPEETHPAVFWLGNCTGTFVSDNTLLTAAHCIGSSNTVRIRRRINATSLKVKVHPKTQVTGRLGAYDIAVVVFPDNTAPAVVSVKTSPVKPGDEALFVGYGRNSSSGGSGVKRVGRNKVRSIDGGKTIVSSRSTSNPNSGEDVSVAPGDSGGPLFINGAIAGITSWHSNYSRSGHANLTAEPNQEFLRAAISELGARFQMDNQPQSGGIRIALGQTDRQSGKMRVFAAVPSQTSTVTFTDLATGDVYQGVPNGSRYSIEFYPGVRNSIDIAINAFDASGQQVAQRKIRLRTKR